MKNHKLPKRLEQCIQAADVKTIQTNKSEKMPKVQVVREKDEYSGDLYLIRYFHCGYCVNFQTRFFDELKQHIDDIHLEAPAVPYDNKYKAKIVVYCKKCENVTNTLADYLHGKECQYTSGN